MLLYEDMKAKILGVLGDYELVFVDDGSGDNSWEIMNQIREMDDRVKLVKLSRNFGEHAAILAGLAQCTGRLRRDQAGRSAGRFRADPGHVRQLETGQQGGAGRPCRAG